MDLGIDLVLVSDLTRREDARFVDTHPGSLALRDAGAQVLKTLCRLGHRLGYIPEDITTDFEMPRVPKTIVPTFSDEQLQALLAVPARRTWVGTRDRAILLVLVDTLIRVSELVGLPRTSTSTKA